MQVGAAHAPPQPRVRSCIAPAAPPNWYPPLRAKGLRGSWSPGQRTGPLESIEASSRRCGGREGALSSLPGKKIFWHSQGEERRERRVGRKEKKGKRKKGAQHADAQHALRIAYCGATRGGGNKGRGKGGPWSCLGRTHTMPDDSRSLQCAEHVPRLPWALPPAPSLPVSSLKAAGRGHGCGVEENSSSVTGTDLDLAE